ncbi:DUF1203 domain-containing protein [Streptomyces sp. S6]
MTSYTVLPIDPAALKELRVTDDAGRPCVPYTATPDDTGSPLRCCLRPVEPGERIALISYAPLRRWAASVGARPGAYDEQGPVFVHADECGGFSPGERYPFDRPGALRTVRRYDAALDDAFSDPDVALVHVRALEFGCFHFEVRRP